MNLSGDVRELCGEVLRILSEISFKSQKHPALSIYIIVHNMQEISLTALCSWLSFQGFCHFVIRNMDLTLSYFKKFQGKVSIYSVIIMVSATQGRFPNVLGMWVLQGGHIPTRRERPPRKIRCSHAPF